MNRRDFVAGGCAACGALLAPAIARAQDWSAPARFTRPDLTTDEGGLWSIMDREERQLRRSPFAVRDPQLHAYVQDIACRLAGDHCPDVRVHIVRTPIFNANMAPNGMMQIWTGLLLRMENEAQLAAVIGHEIGHYVERHTLERLRDVKARVAFAQFLGAFGLIGAVAQIGVLASAMAYGRDQERAADRIGLALMRKAGYDTAEVPRMWGNLIAETNARPGGDPYNPLFATHPAPAERQEALAQMAAGQPGGSTHEEAWRDRIKPHLREWLLDEIRRGQHEEGIALMSRMIERLPKSADYVYARAEIYRLRAKDGDLDAALADYEAAARIGGEPPETHRGLGLVHRTRKQAPEAKASFQRYLELAPNAPDGAMIKSYLEET
ncbi:MAG TPA: M48 family metalloprotease [Burkholderiales bacterium]|nr:M48 family metalloprotease [Burkholderiales bacterium]